MYSKVARPFYIFTSSGWKFPFYALTSIWWCRCSVLIILLVVWRLCIIFFTYWKIREYSSFCWSFSCFRKGLGWVLIDIFFLLGLKIVSFNCLFSHHKISDFAQVLLLCQPQQWALLDFGIFSISYVVKELICAILCLLYFGLSPFF